MISEQIYFKHEFFSHIFLLGESLNYHKRCSNIKKAYKSSFKDILFLKRYFEFL